MQVCFMTKLINNIFCGSTSNKRMQKIGLLHYRFKLNASAQQRCLEKNSQGSTTRIP
uniref:Uncharacterized protein n=1 Tax=Arundo donax TaxID=35708 RepID=A0A0A8Z043_ARUDO